MKQESTQKIFKRGEKILETRMTPIEKDEFSSEPLKKIAAELINVASNFGAVGFAAPQLGYPKRVMMIGMEFDNPRRPNLKQFPNTIFINPEVTYESPEKEEDWEGCASIDDILAYVSRSVFIKYKAQDLNGEYFEGELNGFIARVFLHELDHLNGILMSERATQIKARDATQAEVISMKSS